MLRILAGCLILAVAWEVNDKMKKLKKAVNDHKPA